MENVLIQNSLDDKKSLVSKREKVMSILLLTIIFTDVIESMFTFAFQWLNSLSGIAYAWTNDISKVIYLAAASILVIDFLIIIFSNKIIYKKNVIFKYILYVLIFLVSSLAFYYSYNRFHKF